MPFAVTSEQLIQFLGVTASVGLIFQIVIFLVALGVFRAAQRERAALDREMFGLVRKLEGLTATKREQVLRHYDSMLETISHRLPPIIAAQTSQTIFDTESRILNRLAELEPNLKGDAASKQKMDELIRSMENLEATLVSSAAETVKKVMTESRRTLFDDDLSTNHPLEM